MTDWSVFPSLLTIIGLLLDIIGIYLLYRHGVVGSAWIEAPMPGLMGYATEENTAGPAQQVVHNRRKAKTGARRGLWIAGSGFGLQIVAQFVTLWIR